MMLFDGRNDATCLSDQKWWMLCHGQEQQYVFQTTEGVSIHHRWQHLLSIPVQHLHRARLFSTCSCTYNLRCLIP
jgi:hypothetical protein